MFVWGHQVAKRDVQVYMGNFECFFLVVSSLVLYLLMFVHFCSQFDRKKPKSTILLLASPIVTEELDHITFYNNFYNYFLLFIYFLFLSLRKVRSGHTSRSSLAM